MPSVPPISQTAGRSGVHRTVAERRRSNVRWSDEHEPQSVSPKTSRRSLDVDEGGSTAEAIVRMYRDEDASTPRDGAARDARDGKPSTPYPRGEVDPFDQLAGGDPSSQGPINPDARRPSKPLSNREHAAARGSSSPPSAINTSRQARLADETASPSASPSRASPLPPSGALSPQQYHNGTSHAACQHPMLSLAHPHLYGSPCLPYYPGSPQHAAAPYSYPQPAYPEAVYHGFGVAATDPRFSLPQVQPCSPRSMPGYRSAPCFPPGPAPTQPRAMYDIYDGLDALQEELEATGQSSTETLIDATVAAEAGKLEIAGGGGDPTHRTSRPLKPALRRGTTTDSVLAAQEPTRNAGSIVDAHVQRRRGRHSSANHGETEATGVTGGVLSHLLGLYGDKGAMARNRSQNSATTCAESITPSRASSVDSRYYHGGGDEVHATEGELRQRKPIKRCNSETSIATNLFETAPDAASAGARRKPPQFKRSMSVDSDALSMNSTRSVNTFRSLMNTVQDKLGGLKPKKRSRRASITKNVADILKRQSFILKLAKALMATGAPSHRLETQLNATARVLQVDAQFFHLPSIVIATFGDYDTRTSETHFVKSVGCLNLGKLQRVHQIYKSVVHDETGAAEGSAAIDRILSEGPIYSAWQRMVIAFFCCGIICMLGFNGSFVDAWASGAFGAFLAFMQLRAAKNSLYSNIFEISVATIVSFVSRGLAKTNMFCYDSISSSGVTLILPGYTILCGSLELASKNLIAGSVRMVYSIIYSLFLGFGISVGSDFYYLLDPQYRAEAERQQAKQAGFTLTGTFSGVNGTLPITAGTFTLTNATRAAASYLREGSVQCYRDPDWAWYRQSIHPLWMLLLVPMFSTFSSLWNMQPLKTKELPVMIFIACVGYGANYTANRFIFNRSDVVSFLGAFVIGMLGNGYSRLFRGTAFTSMVTGVLFLVPSGIAAAGGLAMTERDASGDTYSNGLIIGFRMVQVAIGITVGLFFSSFVWYSFGRGKSTAAFTF